MTEYNPCECPIAGYCERYKKKMDPIKHKLCQTREDYRMLFDEIAGNADFGMWKTAKKGNLPSNVAKKVIIKYRDKENQPTISPEKQQEIVQEHRKVEQAVNELEKQGINKDTLNKVDTGLGDTVQRVLSKFGITEKLMSKVLNRTCNCQKRKEFLNRLVPYIKKE